MHATLRLTTALAILAGSHALAQNGPPPAAPVSVAPVVSASVSGQIQLIGRVEPLRYSTVAAEASGVIKEVLFKDGDTLSAGDVLTRQDTALPALEAASANAALGAAQAAWTQSSNALVRATALHTSQQISDADYETVLANETTLRFQASQAKAQLSKADVMLNRTATRMPYNGVVTRKHVELGKWLDAGGTVADVVDLSHVYAVLDLPETRIKDVNRNADVSLYIDGREEPYTGRIDAIIPAADPEAHTLPLRVLCNNEKNAFVAGMYVRASISTTDRADALLVPKDAIVRSGGNATIYVVIDNTPVPVSVHTGAAFQDHVVVRGDVEAGQSVVVRGNERLRPGMAVEITETLETFKHP